VCPLEGIERTAADTGPTPFPEPNRMASDGGKRSPLWDAA